jgi:signal transduction histidine kinase
VRVVPAPAHSSEVVVLLDDLTASVDDIVRAERAACRARTAVLAANVAHEMRNPLSALSLSLQVVGGSLGELGYRFILDKLQAQILRLDRIVEDLVEFARPLSAVVRGVDLAELVHDAVLASIPAARIHVDGPSAALADPALLQQALTCLLTQARESASGPEGIVVRVGPGPRFTISDDGPPLSAADRDHLFQPFTRIRTPGGSALALATARKLVEAMGGTLDLVLAGQTTLGVSLPSPEGPWPSPVGSEAHSG